MAAGTTGALRSALPPDSEPQPRRWTREEYYRAGDLGLFGPGERLELIDGEIIRKMSPQRRSHAIAVSLTDAALSDAFDRISAHVRVQLPLTFPDDSEPEPDLAVVAGRIRDYESRDGHPAPTDVLLILEVSDTTLRYDRTVKASLYAQAGIGEYWVLNLPERSLVVHRDPQAGVYAGVSLFGESGAVAPLSAPSSLIAVKDMLPSAGAPL